MTLPVSISGRDLPSSTASARWLAAANPLDRKLATCHNISVLIAKYRPGNPPALSHQRS
jgi:hypothetical protein